MKIKMSIIVMTLLNWSMLLTNCMGAEETLRVTLESTWNKYLEASNSGIEAELEKVMSSYRLITMKNNLISANRSFTPEMIKSIAKYAPAISGAEFVQILGKGLTAGLIYEMDSGEKDASGETRVKFMFIKFVRENEMWKVDGGIEIGSPKFQPNGEMVSFNPANLPPTFEIDGQVLKAPALLISPEVSALLDIYCPGFNIQITINGVQQESNISSSYTGLISGGLKQGQNDIELLIHEVEKGTSFKPKITIKRILENKNTEDVFIFEPKEKVEGKHRYNFTI